MRPRREPIIGDTLNNRLVHFDDGTSWRLVEKKSEEPWEGWLQGDDESEWDPYEAHACYLVKQVDGPQPGKQAIVKARIEVPWILDPDETPAERAKHALGMRLNSNTQNEIKQLQRVTEAGYEITPKLLAVRIEQQDETLMCESASQGGVRWWMPGGYVVYLLMEKLPAAPLSYRNYWQLGASERQEIRNSFQEGFCELAAHGNVFEDSRIDNLMWSKDTKQCYFIDFEDAHYRPDEHARPWNEGEFLRWGLTKTYDEPHY